MLNSKNSHANSVFLFKLLRLMICNKKIIIYFRPLSKVHGYLLEDDANIITGIKPPVKLCYFCIKAYIMLAMSANY